VVVLYIDLVDTLMESRKDLRCLETRHPEKAAPDLGRGKAAYRETRDDTEIVGAAFQGEPKVGIG
jgi:hypothetical protein